MSDPLLLPPPPRPITPAARRRSWAEPAVRAWLLGALILVAFAGYSIGTSILARADQNWLLSHGKAVEATVWPNGRSSASGIAYPAEGSFTLRFPWNDKVAKIETSFPERREMIMSGSAMTLYVDPADPAHWTMKSAVSHWWSGMISGIILCALAMLLFMMASLLRRQRLRWFEVGEMLDAIVVDTKTTPLAPLSLAVRCSNPMEEGQRVMTVYLPSWAGRVRAGEMIQLICVKNRPERALAAAAYFR